MSDALAIQAPPELENEGNSVLEWARGLQITTPSHYADAADQLKGIKSIAKRVEDYWKPLKANALATHRAIVARENDMLKPLGEAEKFAKSAMLTYTRAEEEKRLAEQRRLQKIADEKAARERMLAEAEAARQRAIEDEARQKANEARAKAAEADAAERKRLLAAAAAADRKAEAANIKAEANTETAAAVVAPVVQVAPRTEKVEGVVTRKAWKAEVVDLDAFLTFVFANNRRDLVVVNDAVLQALAKGLKENATMPGVRFFADEVLSARGKA